MPDLKHELSKKIVDKGRLSRDTIEWWVKKDEQQGVEMIFWNFVHYLRDSKWAYVASSPMSASNSLLKAEASGSIMCEALCNAFVGLTIDVFLHFETNRGFKFAKECIGSFITKQGYCCFDSRAHGNVRRSANSYVDENRCYFKEHHVQKYGNRFYDPTFGQIYDSKEECLEWHVARADPKYTNLANYLFANNGKIVLAVLSAEKPTGFGQGYLLTDSTHLSAAKPKAVYQEYAKNFDLFKTA
ncbi:MAG: hypothetical protein JXN61_14260 [Sedimentisphaerales bacterium]|nr:hypothetical protein [Sedimentisphaerales bacterium]